MEKPKSPKSAKTSLALPPPREKMPAGAKRPDEVKTRRPPSQEPYTEGGNPRDLPRFSRQRPEPKGELEHVNPFTLVVAVALSAQATDAGVNKATRALFAVADTPEKMLALGEDRVRDYIKTIGLYRNKAKNVIALSQKAGRRFRW
jgi:endonuclease-3